MAKRTSKTAAKFQRVAALNSMVDARDDTSRDARRAKRMLSDQWYNRRPGGVQGYHKAKNAKPGLCYVTRYE